MENGVRVGRALRVVRGVLLACALSIVGIIAVAAALLFILPSDGEGGESALKWLGAVIQFIKVASIISGVFYAVGRGGEKGLITGVLTGSIYMLVGFGIYAVISKADISITAILIEMFAGALVGGIAGVLFANMRPSVKKR